MSAHMKASRFCICHHSRWRTCITWSFSIFSEITVTVEVTGNYWNNTIRASNILYMTAGYLLMARHLQPTGMRSWIVDFCRLAIESVRVADQNMRITGFSDGIAHFPPFILTQEVKRADHKKRNKTGCSLFAVRWIQSALVLGVWVGAKAAATAAEISNKLIRNAVLSVQTFCLNCFSLFVETK